MEGSEGGGGRKKSEGGGGRGRKYPYTHRDSISTTNHATTQGAKIRAWI